MDQGVEPFPQSEMEGEIGMGRRLVGVVIARLAIRRPATVGLNEDGEASSRPTNDLILRCRISGLEGGFQISLRQLEASFEAGAALRHLRMRSWGGSSSGHDHRESERPVDADRVALRFAPPSIERVALVRR